MQKWQKKKTHFPLITLVFFAFIALTILYNESYLHKIHADDSDGDRRRLTVQGGSSSLNPTPAHNLNLSEKPSVGLDKFTECSSEVRYSGRRAISADKTAEFSGRMATPEVRTCDLFSGKWVFDNVSYPLYIESACPFMSDQLACHKHGRPDLGYQFWRWQPQNCNLKRWNAVEMWEKLRGKRLMFVGDSLNRGQWISLVCLLESVIPADKQFITSNFSELTVFRAENYNATVEFLWAPLLVESNSDDPVSHRLNKRIIRPDAILRHSSRWEQADILIFNSYLWWRGPVKLLWSNEENNVCEDISGLGGMELAMELWADWVSNSVDPSKKKVFFVTMSPTHQSKNDWEPKSKGNCYDEKEPIHDKSYWGRGSDLPTMRMLEKVLSRLGSKVSVLNVTQLSEYRKDGHPTIYRKFWEQLGPERLANPASYSDCIHWCLPGVPDVWNELLFQLL